MKKVTAILVALCAMVTALAGGTPAPASAALHMDWRAQRPSARQFATLRERAQRAGTVRAIVGLQTDWTADGRLSATARSSQHQRIGSASTALLDTLHGRAHRVIRRYRTLPMVALELSPAAVDALQRGGRAATLSVDRLNAPALAESVPLVEADDAARLGFGGAGQTIAVLDTGVDAGHPFFGGRVIGGCNVVALCMDLEGQLPYSGPCTYSPECAHGTHVAGIAAGRSSSFSGVAPDATIVSMKVFEREDDNAWCQQFAKVPAPCPAVYDDTALAALDEIAIEHSLYNFAAANLSFGGGDYKGTCPFSPYALAVADLASYKIATVVASGNDLSKSTISSPACAPGAISVGNTTKSDTVNPTSQSSPILSLLAPGTSITSSVPGGGFQSLSGTSMAAPHVAGAFADLKSRVPAADVNTLLGVLQQTGKPVTDSANGQTTPRLRVLSALVLFADTGFGTNYSSPLSGGRVYSEGTGLRPGSGTITLNTIPSGTAVKNAYLYFATVHGADTDGRALVNGVPVPAELIGASRDPCTGSNGSAARVYRADVTGVVTGNGSYTVSGIGGSGSGEGASLVVVTARPSFKERTVQIRDGAMTALPGETMTHTFGLAAPKVFDPELNVGLGAGDAGTEGPMTLGTTAVFGANAFTASDGAWWDDRHASVKAPDNQLSPVNSLTTGSDCLHWAYAALSYAN